MKRQHSQAGQSLVEYSFLMVLLATIGVAVIIMAGSQLKSLYNDVAYEFSHLTDTTVIGSPICPDGSPARLGGHKYKCNGIQN
jgi:hypothetical protein